VIGIIESTNKSQSGKTLGVKIGGTYYTTKNWELADMVGKEIVFEPEASEFNGKTMYWLNEYSVSGTQPTPAAAAMDQALTQATPDKDALIGAMALTKACTAVDAPAVWSNFLYFYDQLKGWNPNEPF
jgi:hypothetical protein